MPFIVSSIGAPFQSSGIGDPSLRYDSGMGRDGDIGSPRVVLRRATGAHARRSRRDGQIVWLLPACSSRMAIPAWLLAATTCGARLSCEDFRARDLNITQAETKWNCGDATRNKKCFHLLQGLPAVDSVIPGTMCRQRLDANFPIAVSIAFTATGTPISRAIHRAH